MLKGFKDFLLRGNVVDLAVAVVVGTAFTAVVTAFTSAFLKPLIQVFSGGGQFAGTFVVNGVEFDYASFINAVITFLITAAVIYFLVVYPLEIVAARRKRGEEEGPAEPTDVELLTEIRDLLRDQAAASPARHAQDTPGGQAGGPASGGGTGSGPDPAGGPTPNIPHQDR